MQRTFVRVATMRILDLAVGDVVNPELGAWSGWFVVEEIRRLPNGEINVTNTSSRASVMGAPHDLVGVQVCVAVEHHGAPPPGESTAAWTSPRAHPSGSDRDD